MKATLAIAAATCLCFSNIITLVSATELVGTVLDADSGKPIPARVYVQNTSGRWLFVESAAAEGSALPYREHRRGLYFAA